MIQNRLYYHLFGNLSEENRQKLIAQMEDLDQKCILGLTEEETFIIRSRLGIFGKEASIYKNIAKKGKTVPQVTTKIDKLNEKVQPFISEFVIKEKLKEHQITSLDTCTLTDLKEIFGEQAALELQTYAHEHNLLLRSENKEDLMSIKLLNLSPRNTTVLFQSGVRTVGQLIQMTQEELESIRDVGPKRYEEIIKGIDKAGYSLKLKEDSIQNDQEIKSK